MGSSCIAATAPCLAFAPAVVAAAAATGQHGLLLCCPQVLQCLLQTEVRVKAYCCPVAEAQGHWVAPVHQDVGDVRRLPLLLLLGVTACAQIGLQFRVQTAGGSRGCRSRRQAAESGRL